MIRNFLLSITSIFWLTSLSAQTSLQGMITDEEGKPMPFVNVGVPGCNGTVSDLNGEFQLGIAECKASDTLLVSMIGYKTQLNILNTVHSPVSIRMERSQYELQEVKIKSGKLKEKEKGNFTDSDHMIAGFKSNDLGSEIVIRIPVKHDAWVKKFRFYIVKSVFDTLYFRLNVYKMENGKPGENILKHPVYVTTVSKHGWNAVDLAKYNIVSDGDFAIGLEWIRDFKKENVAQGLMFSVGFLNKNCYYRKASQQSWNSTSPVGIGFNVVVAE